MISAQPLPEVDQHTREYWEGCRRHELVAQVCSDCGQLRFPPRPMCPNCNSMSFVWKRMSGKGKVLSWTICHPPVLPAFADRVPYNVSLVELDEGIRLVSSLVECPPDEIEFGMPVEVIFEEVTEEITLPKFRRVPRE